MNNKLNLYIMDISDERKTSGVDRYVEILLSSIQKYSWIHVCRIHFEKGPSVLFHKKEERWKNYTYVIIPIPQQSDEIIGEKYWLQKYNEYVFSLVKDLFENKVNRIIHIHTLNLIAFASLVKTQFSCKIITHLHCIPWKSFYDTNRMKFNQLYTLSNSIALKTIISQLFFTNNCEWESYTVPDQIICITQCAKLFLQKIMNVPDQQITVISNGINDSGSDVEYKTRKEPFDTFQCFFVGVHSESKGIFYILQALRKVQAQGYQVCLNTAGDYSYNIYKQITEEYKDLQVNILGRISFEELQYYYRESDIGIIASLQEQCSYVAIEMSMFGLTIITTAVDGLDEMFTDGVNALKVNTRFSKVFGLSVDTDELADKIITLIEDDDLRKQLGMNARKLYQERFNLENMMEQTIAVYKNLSSKET